MTFFGILICSLLHCVHCILYSMTPFWADCTAWPLRFECCAPPLCPALPYMLSVPLKECFLIFNLSSSPSWSFPSLCKPFNRPFYSKKKRKEKSIFGIRRFYVANVKADWTHDKYLNNRFNSILLYWKWVLPCTQINLAVIQFFLLLCC